MKMKTHPIFWLVAILACAAVPVIFFAVQPSRAAGPWYVAPGSDDSYDCLSPVTACATINGALNKPGFVAGDTILVATGVYTGTGTEVVRLNKSATLSGGWDAGFTTQSGTSTIDGQGARRGITVNLGIAAVVERFDVQNGYNGITNEGTLTLNNSAVQNGRNGIQNKGTLTLNNSIVSGNRTDGSGGGINNMMGSVGVLILNNSTVSGNTANGVGGGILNQHRQITLNNSTVSGNRSNGLGGGIHNGSGTAILNNSTVSANTAGESGGGIYNWDGAVTLQNSILGGNTAASGPDCSGAAVGSAGYNLVGSTSGCTFSASTGDLTDVSARLGLLIGSPGYLPLLSGSPAIDAGNPDGCSGSSGPLTTDQRGAARVGRCDIGAYEYTVPGPAASIYAFGGTPQTAPPSVVFRTPLQAAVLDSIGSPVNSATVSFLAPASGASGTFADSGTLATSAVTNESGVATAAMFTANGLSGSYVVTAAVAGVVTPADFLLANKAWYVSPNGDDANDCQAPTTPCSTINGPLKKPGFVADDTVLVATGVYTGTGDQVVLLDRNAALSGGWDAGFTTQSGTSTIDGQGARRGITVNLGITAVVERFAVQNGNGGSNGGGIDNDGNLTLNDCTVSGNAVSSGEYYGAGGGIHNNGAATLNHCTVSGNTNDMYGGGIYSGQGTLTLNDSTVSGNTANYGGGVFNDVGTIILQSSVLRENTASLGGGIYKNGGTTTLNQSAISGNKVNSAGGGVYNSNGTVTLNNSAVSGNTARGSGGGISNKGGWDAGTVTLNNSTLSGNTADEYCGGVANGGTLILNNTTFTGNKAGISGGGVCNGSVTLRNSILSGNTADSAPECYAATISSAGYNLIGSTSDCTFSPGIGDLTNVDPNLGPLEGLPAYHPLLPDSPPVNGGNPAGCQDDKGNPLPTDQRGFPRFGRCDIGAYELQPIGFSTLTADPSDALPGDPLTYTLALKNAGATDIANVRVTDTLPISLSYLDSSLTATSGSYGYQNSVITWTGAVNAGGPVTITYGAAVKPTAHLSATIANSAVIDGGGEKITRTAFVYIPPAKLYLPLVSRDYCARFSDDFSNPASGWPIADDGRLRWEYLSGEYRMLVRPIESWAGARPGVRCCSYTVAVDVRNPSGVDGTYGLIFGLSDNWQQFYSFEIGPDGYYYLWRYDNGNWTSLTYGYSSSIKTGTGTNRLKVERTSAQIIAYVNNQMLVNTSDAMYTGLRHVGLIASSYDQPKVDARYDNFVMCAPGCSAADSLTEAGITSQNKVSPPPPWSAGAASGTTGSKITGPSGLVPQPDSEPTEP
jgi:uncharacterized repeat protein (TIGR01451 family)